MSSTSQLFFDAADIIERNGWVQKPIDDDDNADGYCLMQAVGVAAELTELADLPGLVVVDLDNHFIIASSSYRRMRERGVLAWDCLYAWNDARWRRKKTVVKELRELGKTLRHDETEQRTKDLGLEFQHLVTT